MINGKSSKPLTFEELTTQNYLMENELIWFEGLDDWTEVKNIPELKDFMVKTPPKTSKEVFRERFFKNLRSTIMQYTIYCTFLGMLSASLELYQYKKFDAKITHNYNSLSYGVPISDIYVKEDDGLYTRWCAYKGGSDNEQISYDTCHEFWFRSYKAIFSDTPLDFTERRSFILLLWNFIASSLLSSLPLLVIIFIYNYKWKRQKSTLS